MNLVKLQNTKSAYGNQLFTYIKNKPFEKEMRKITIHLTQKKIKTEE